MRLIKSKTCCTAIVFFICILAFFNACKNKDTTAVTKDHVPVIYKTDTSALQNNRSLNKPPVINITDTVSIKRMVLVMKDSAVSSERIGIKMSDIYRKILPEIIKKQNLQVTGPRMAWYKTSSPPFFFEAGIPVDKKPVKLPKNIFIKMIGTDSAVVAHFYGPYAQTFLAYEAIRDWMKFYKKRTAGEPFEVYIDEMYDKSGKAVNPYRVRTDIVFPRK